MKQFLLNVLATVVGVFVTMMIFSFLSVIMLFGLLAAGMSEEAPNVKKNTVLQINLEGVLEERSSPTSFADQLMALNEDAPKPMSLADLTAAIDAASKDDKIAGIYLD
ncbi:MAG: hypothetical protein K2M98_00660, partial [Muribaculum sp.]|nr:hypothetical protein [Muribaculum sp.]